MCNFELAATHTTLIRRQRKCTCLFHSSGCYNKQFTPTHANFMCYITTDAIAVRQIYTLENTSGTDYWMLCKCSSVGNMAQSGRYFVLYKIQSCTFEGNCTNTSSFKKTHCVPRLIYFMLRIIASSSIRMCGVCLSKMTYCMFRIILHPHLYISRECLGIMTYCLG